MADKVFVCGEVVKSEPFESKLGKAMASIVVLTDDSAIKTMAMVPMRDKVGGEHRTVPAKGDYVELLVDADLDSRGRGISYFVSGVWEHTRGEKSLLKAA